MNPTSFQPERRNVENKSSSSVNIRFVAKTWNIRNFHQNIRSDAKTSEVATLKVNVNLLRGRLTAHCMQRR